MSNEYIFKNLQSSQAFYRTENIANYYYWLTSDLTDFMDDPEQELKGERLEIAKERHNELIFMEHLTKSYWNESKAKFSYTEKMRSSIDCMQLQTKSFIEESKPLNRYFYKDEDIKITRTLDQLQDEINYIDNEYMAHADQSSIDFLLTLAIRDFEAMLVYQVKALYLDRLTGSPDKVFIQVFENTLHSFSTFLIEGKTLHAGKYKNRLHKQFIDSGYENACTFDEYLDRYLRVLASWEFVIQSSIDSCQHFVNPDTEDFDESDLDFNDISSAQMTQSNLEYYAFLASIPTDLNVGILKPLKDSCPPHPRFEKILTTWRSAYGI